MGGQGSPLFSGIHFTLALVNSFQEDCLSTVYHAVDFKKNPILPYAFAPLGDSLPVKAWHPRLVCASAAAKPPLSASHTPLCFTCCTFPAAPLPFDKRLCPH
jgi:hypothetical protein